MFGVIAPHIPFVDWLTAVTARLGYVAGPWLIYARGGYAATKVTFIGTTPGDFVSVDGARNGWTLGGGVEYMLWRNVSVALGYNHYDFGTRRYLSTTVGGLPLNSNVAFTLDSVMLRANYRFGG
jgi:outer membrane immunogenic protein